MTRLALLIGLLLVCTPAWAGETRTFEDDNLRWTLPEGWSFHKVSRMQANAGFLVAASHDDVAADLSCARFEAQEGVTLDKLLKDLTDWGRSRLRNAETSKSTAATLSGLAGKVAFVQGEVADRASAHFRYYAVRHEHQFYVLVMQTWDGTHRTQQRALDAARRGLRLIEGAGPSEKPLAGFGELGPDPEIESHPAGGPVWSETSPRREGDTIVFPSHDLRWTVRETPFALTYVTNDERKTGQIFLVYEAARERRVPKDDAMNTCKLRLTIEDKPRGFDAVKLVRDEEWQDAKAAGLEKRLPKGVSFKDGVALGNATASYVQIRGMVGDAHRTLAYYVVAVRDRIYTWHAMATGEEAVYTLFRGEVERLLAGARFSDTRPGVAGPWLAAVSPQTKPRGADVERKVGFELPGARVVKPPGLGVLTLGDAATAALALEGRTEAGYAYVEVRVAAAAAPVAARQSQALAKARAKAWTDTFGASAVVAAPETDTWAGETCRTAHLTGMRDGVTYTERSWWIGHADHLYVVRVQYGGDAETALGAAFAAFRESWTFEN